MCPLRSRSRKPVPRASRRRQPISSNAPLAALRHPTPARRGGKGGLSGFENRGPQPHFLPDCRSGLCCLWHDRLAVSAWFDRREDWCRASSAEALSAARSMRERGPSRSPRPLRLSKVTVLVPEGCVEGLSQFARDLCQRQEAGTCGQWRKLSPSAELMVDPGCGARCAIRDTGAPGEGRCHWTVTVFDELVRRRRGTLGSLRRHDPAQRKRSGPISLLARTTPGRTLTRHIHRQNISQIPRRPRPN